ncbi:MAG: serine/threonine phosphatase [Cyanobacteria bacterium RM1_2_2]|nr:serine/threonine phosphatase [Cyanobacteria bacterium RM1_2_2]
MLVCPRCRFENPDTHKFCQDCGVSLTEQECSACGLFVVFKSEYCLQCGTVTGTTWKAILSPLGATVRWAEPAVALTDLSDPTDADAAITLPDGKFLDSQQRYQLLEPLPQQIALSAEFEVRVLDHQPLQASLLSCLYQQQELQTKLAEPAATAELPAEIVPEPARPYLELQEQFPFLSLPYLHDAWQQEGLNILLLEDRSNLPLLVDLWVDEDVLPLQMLHWLHEMTELWAALDTQGCCRSLLDLGNLRVDEDYLLCLQRLYPDLPQQPTELSQLGRLWQKLFQPSQRAQNVELSRLCAELDAGTITALSHLQARIEAIADTLQVDAPMTAHSQPSLPESSLMSHDIDDPNLETDWQDPNLDMSQDLPTAPPTQPLHQFPTADDSASANSATANSDSEPAVPIAVDADLPTEVIEDEEGANADDLPTVVLAMKLVSLEDAGRTDIGRQRDHNEDCFSVQTDVKKVENPQGRTFQAKGLYILCDGMGGHASGEVASALAVETLQRFFAEHWQDNLPNEEKIREAIRQANRAIYDLNQQNASAGSGRMGTTLVLLLIHDGEAAIAHVGDSRLYFLSRRRGLQQLTVDHEVGQREIQRGVESTIAYARPDAYQLTQALGPRDENFLSPDVKFMELNEDGILLLCSDGLSDNDLLETHWQSHLEPMLDQRMNLEQGVNQLIDLANRYNGHDNITAIAVRLRVRPNLEQVSR